MYLQPRRSVSAKRVSGGRRAPHSSHRYRRFGSLDIANATRIFTPARSSLWLHTILGLATTRCQLIGGRQAGFPSGWVVWDGWGPFYLEVPNFRYTPRLLTLGEAASARYRLTVERRDRMFYPGGFLFGSCVLLTGYIRPQGWRPLIINI